MRLCKQSSVDKEEPLQNSKEASVSRCTTGKHQIHSSSWRRERVCMQMMAVRAIRSFTVCQYNCTEEENESTRQEDQDGAGGLRRVPPAARVGPLPTHVHEQRLYQRQVHLIRVRVRLVARHCQRALGRAARLLARLRVQDISGLIIGLDLGVIKLINGYHGAHMPA